MSKNIVFCGGGNMAEGIMGGLLSKGVATPEAVTVNELLPQRREYLAETYGVNAVADASAAIQDADLVLIAVNPHQVPSVTAVVKPLVKAGAIVLSIAAGVTLATLESQLGSDKKIVRVMPNTLIKAGNGYSAACVNGNLNDDDKAFITQLLDALGQTMYIREEMFNAFTPFSCSGPMWMYKMAEVMINAGVYIGFSRAEARGIVIRNMMGVAQTLEATGAHPAVKIDEMTSPGGVTIEAVKVLEEEGFAAALMNSVSIAVDKANAIE